MHASSFLLAALVVAAEAGVSRVFKIDAAAMDYLWTVTNWEAGHTPQGAYYGTSPCCSWEKEVQRIGNLALTPSFSMAAFDVAAEEFPSNNPIPAFSAHCAQSNAQQGGHYVDCEMAQETTTQLVQAKLEAASNSTNATQTMTRLAVTYAFLDTKIK